MVFATQQYDEFRAWTHFVVIGRKTKTNREFYREIGFSFGMSICWNVCTMFLEMDDACVDSACLFRFVYCIRFQLLCVSKTHTISTFPKHSDKHELTKTNVIRNNADNFNGNTIDEHHLLLKFMQLRDRFVWTMVSYGYRNGKLVYQWLLGCYRREKKRTCKTNWQLLISLYRLYNLRKLSTTSMQNFEFKF